MKEHDREQILVLFAVGPEDDYLPRAALAVARLAGGVGARMRHGPHDLEAGARGPHQRRVEHEDLELVVLSEEPLDGEGERAARFGLALLHRGLVLARRMEEGDRELARRLEEASLGPRERELALHLVGGRSTQQIAEAMSLTPASVRTYVKRILGKTGVRSRLQLIAWLKDR